jgi:uncharacterized protein (UPF0371 family)
LSKIDDELHLIAPMILEPIRKLKKDSFGSTNLLLDAEEILIALSISAVTNPIAQVAVNKLKLLKGCQAHCTTILTAANESIIRKLQIEATSEPVYFSSSLYEGN